jgi:methylisocitrate lyase
MTVPSSAGARFRAALAQERPLQVVGTVNAYSALLAERAGFRAIYLSGAGVANASFGLPDLGITSLNDVCEDVRRIASASDLPLLVDADTGWGAAFNISRTIADLVRSGAAGCHLEDQVQAKRCGHRPGKALVSAAEMVDRIRAAADGRSDGNFVIMARTDAHAVEGQQAAIERAQRYVEAGADMIFAEALTTLDEYRQFTVDELGATGVKLVLYPLSAFRAMSRAAERVYAAIRLEGTQRGVLDSMQTREQLYGVLDYYAYERKLDALFAANGSKSTRQRVRKKRR